MANSKDTSVTTTTATPAAAEAVPSTSTNQLRFPTIFSIYYKHTNKTLTTSTFHLGEHQSQPRFAATFHMGWSGKSDLSLHAGPSVDTPIIGTAETTRLLSNNSTIKISSPPAPQPVSERLRVDYHLTSESYQFAVAIGTEEHAYPEKYEWRQSHGEEVRGVGTWPWGWKLVRLTSDTPDGQGGKRGSRQAGESSDGKEIVAVLGETLQMTRKAARLQFLGSGATGELGDVWSIMVVLTGLRIYQFRWSLNTL